VRVSAELSRDVVSELKGLSAVDLADFHRQLELLCEDPASPIKRSELFYDQAIGPYALRRFTFGAGVERLAVFHYDFDRNRVRVIACRLSRPRRWRRRAGPPGMGPA
jgi:hypothetical protein